jgi:hypothetical protein
MDTTMRKLHPIGPQEERVAAGRLRRADGGVETWTVHRSVGDRRVIRVECSPGELWHLVLDAGHRPERLQARLQEEGQTFETTYTFFPDEVLVWRRGAEPASEAIALPPGYRLLWPPVAGRECCLAGLEAREGPAAEMFFSLQRRPAQRGWLRGRPVKFTVRSGPGWLTLDTPGLPPARLELDAAGRLAAWFEGDAVTRQVEHAP